MRFVISLFVFSRLTSLLFASYVSLLAPSAFGQAWYLVLELERNVVEIVENVYQLASQSLASQDGVAMIMPLDDRAVLAGMLDGQREHER